MNGVASLKPATSRGDSRTVTVLAPTPQDAKYCNDILREHGLTVETVTAVSDALRQIRQGTGVLLIAQEFLTGEAIDLLRFEVDRQPSWSDIPILILLSKLEMNSRVVMDLLSLGNVTLMERPLRIALLVSTLKAKLRDRARQYKVRDLLHKAEMASDSKSAFVANISHEIRTPMTSILGYADLMSSLIDNQEAHSYLNTIRRNGDFLLGIINDILDLSKIEAGKFDIEIGSFNPANVIEDVHSVMDIRASEKGVSLEVEYSRELPSCIESDAKRLKQILINLVGNAIKFTSQGSVKIRVNYLRDISTTAAPAKTGRLTFDITDSGIGMTSEQQQRIFEPFSQGDSLITQQFGGTGLGLAISQRLAMMLNGKISVSSSINEGSTFSLTIATRELNDSLFLHPEIPQPAATSNADVHLQAHVLIVDDRRDIRFLSNRIVTMAGGQVTEAEDGVQAIETVRRANSEGRTFDLILLDMHMPNMDGYQAATELRKLGYTNPIIALTADAMQGDMNKCLTAGCNYHIAKPINKLELLKLLHELTQAAPRVH